jgi:hypothetical protein
MPEWCPGDLNKVDKACELFLRSRERLDTPIDWSRVKWIPKVPGTPPPSPSPAPEMSYGDRRRQWTNRTMHAHFSDRKANR